MIVYFSGTGNSRCCAQYLADFLQDACVDAFRYLRDKATVELSSTTPWIFVSPTYAWQIPRVFRDLIRGGIFTGSREAYFVMTCGGETGDAQRQLTALCREKGFSFRGLLPVVMPDNYLVLFPAPKQGEAQMRIAAARPLLAQAAQHIQAGETCEPLHAGLFDRFKSGPINKGMYRYFIRTTPFRTTDACVGCGSCARACPLANIHLEENRPVWGTRCTHCMACLNGCPTAAIEYGRSTRGKARYGCPPYKPGEKP